MAHLVELVGSRHAGRAASHNSHTAAGAELRWLWLHPALLKRLVNDGGLNRLDGHRVLDNAQHAGTLAGSRTYAAGELREGVGGQQPVQGLLPLALVDQVVELRDDVAKGAAGVSLVAEGCTALHAAGSLRVQQRLLILLLHAAVHLLVVLDALLRGAVGKRLALIVDEAAVLVSALLGQHGGPALLPGWHEALDWQAQVRLALQQLEVGLGALGGVVGGYGLGRGLDGALGSQDLEILKGICLASCPHIRVQQGLLCSLGLRQGLRLLQRTPVLGGEHLLEQGAALLPVEQDVAGHRACSELEVALDQALEHLDVLSRLNRQQVAGHVTVAQ
mmetsp:Transcript_30094/g.66684  ORF Transcript_30094/g.66684 Transcript_30094/m.66684 type:complete len:333 (+) Transcript_30094:1854-2852(+)